ncbi:hypothetical protein D3C80_1346830 [compost metagenome]
MVVDGEFDVDLGQFRAHGAHRIGADNRAYRIRCPNRAVSGQRWEVRLPLACERQENLDVRGSGLCRVMAQVWRAKGDAAQMWRNVTDSGDFNQVRRA